MDKDLRNTLRNIVAQCRRLLEKAISEALQGQFGIHASGKVEDTERMGHLSDEEQQYREQILAHLEHIKASGFKSKDVVAQLVREVSFTHLNRLCAYKMMETRGLIREAVGQGLKSQGFLFYLADHPEDEKLWSSGNQYVAYRHYLEWLGKSLSEEIGVLFSPHDPANYLFPPYRVLEQVLDLINSEELKDVWGEDETIGWIYQYFTPKELREKARKESQAPRNSYELAFRNQFYTPRYVVQFLTDNTLGRIWYEIRKGETALKEKCQYLVRRPNE
ncbi:MAG: SAM-dependent methyltransferase, partial [Thermoplasmata archaeon]